MNRSPHIHSFSWRFGAPLVLLALWVAWGAGEAAAAPTCAGKRATIVSNAATIVGTKGHDVIVAGAAANKIYGMGGNDTICAGPGNDTVFAGRGSDLVFGEGGDDAIRGERGNDRLFGGADDDTIRGDRGSDRADGGDGTDVVLGDQGNDRLAGGPGPSDYLDGGAGDDSLDGGPGDFDVVLGGPGNDRGYGGAGEHDIASYRGAGGPVQIDLAAQTVGGAEGERLSGIEDAIGGPGNDTISGSEAANRLDGGPGDDRLVASGPGDEAFGGPGNDECVAGFASETSCGLSRRAVDATVELYSGIDGFTGLVVTGASGADALQVSRVGGAYVVVAEAGGADVALGDPDVAACAAAPRSVSCQGPIVSIQASLGAGSDRFAVASTVPASVASVIDGGKGEDDLQGGLGNDVIYGGDDRDPDVLRGGGGDDVLYGVNIFHPRRDSGRAQMFGGGGHDLMVGGQPCDGDLFHGGPGENDSASFARVRNAGIHVKATIGGAVLDPDISACNAGAIDASTEKIEGSTGPDILVGNSAPNVLLGRGGDDFLDGRGGVDRCVGGGGHNRAVRCEKRTLISARPFPRTSPLFGH